MFVSHRVVESCSLDEAIALSVQELGRCIAFMAAPSSFRVVSIDENGEIDHPVDRAIGTVYSMRAFSGSGTGDAREVRWELTTGPIGRAIVVGTAATPKPESTEVDDTPIEHRYFVGSERPMDRQGWTSVVPYQTLVSVPVDYGDGSVPRLVTHEWLSAGHDLDGNVWVVEETIVGFDSGRRP